MNHGEVRFSYLSSRPKEREMNRKVSLDTQIAFLATGISFLECVGITTKQFSKSLIG